jgi:large subunit ribosomal protein L6
MSKLAIFYLNKPASISFKCFSWTSKFFLIKLQGVYGSIYYSFFSTIFFDFITTTKFYVILNPQKRELQKFLGLFFTLCFSAMQDISLSYKFFLELRGIGFKVFKKKKFLIFDLGYSHQVFLEIPSHILVKILNKKKTKFLILSLNRQKIHEFANIIKLKKIPNEYTLKGIHYKNEILVKKSGKQAQQK